MQLKYIKKITDIPAAERPREKLLKKGEEYLSDIELLAIIIGSGCRDTGVEKIASAALTLMDMENGRINSKKLLSIDGIGEAKAALIAAALEFSRRRLCPHSKKITSPSDVIPIISHYSDRKQEHFITLSLNGAHEVITSRVVSIGLVNRTVVHPREVYADPLTDRAAALIVAHNHPSGNVQPSNEDMEITKRLKEAGQTLGIKLLDHIIFADSAYYSFLEEGKI